MTVKTLSELIKAQPLTQLETIERDVTSGYSCDLLSWVMSHGIADMALITVQTHMNVVAVCSLLDIACMIVPEGITVPDDVVARANEENVAVLITPLTAYEIAGIMSREGIAPAHK